MKDLKLIELSELDDNKLKILKEKAKNGYQLLRLARSGSTATMHTLQKVLSKGEFTNLCCCSFSNKKFSWGEHHRQKKDISWDETFNTRADLKDCYDPNKLIFQIVRNPYDWLTSIYEWDFMGTRKAKNINNFNKYIRYFFQKDYFPPKIFNRCFFQGFDDNDNCKVDVYIRFEYLEEGIQELLNLRGYKLDKMERPKEKITKWSKKNNFNNYKHKYYNNQEIIDLVKNNYNWDLKNFNYSFGGPLDNKSIFVVESIN